MPYPMTEFLEFLIAMAVSIAPIMLVIWLVFAVLGMFRSTPSQRDQLDARAWDQGREIGRLEQEVAELRRRIADLERHRQPYAGD